MVATVGVQVFPVGVESRVELEGKKQSNEAECSQSCKYSEKVNEDTDRSTDVVAATIAARRVSREADTRGGIVLAPTGYCSAWEKLENIRH